MDEGWRWGRRTDEECGQTDVIRSSGVTRYKLDDDRRIVRAALLIKCYDTGAIEIDKV